MKNLIIAIVAFTLLVGCGKGDDNFNEFMGVEFGTSEEKALEYIESEYMAKIEKSEKGIGYLIDMANYEGYDVKQVAIGFVKGEFGYAVIHLKAEDNTEANKIAKEFQNKYIQQLGEPDMKEGKAMFWHIPYKNTGKLLTIGADSLLDSRVIITAGIFPEQLYKKFMKEIEKEKNK